MDGRAVGVLLRISRYGHFDVGEPFDAGNEIGGIAITSGVRRVAFTDAADRIAAQRHDVTHAGSTIIADHAVDLIACRRNASEMGRRYECSLGQNAFDRAVGAFTSGAARAISHGDEMGPQRRQPRNRFPQCAFHLLGLGWKEFERDPNAALVGCMHKPARAGQGIHSGHLAHDGLGQRYSLIAPQPERHRDAA